MLGLNIHNLFLIFMQKTLLFGSFLSKNLFFEMMTCNGEEKQLKYLLFKFITFHVQNVWKIRPVNLAFLKLSGKK